MNTVRDYNCNRLHHDKIEVRVGIATGQVVAGEDVELSLRQSCVTPFFTLTICA